MWRAALAYCFLLSSDNNLRPQLAVFMTSIPKPKPVFEGVVEFLRSAGVQLPPQCAIPEADLHTRVLKALDYAQNYETVMAQNFPKGSMNLSLLPKFQPNKNPEIHRQMLQGYDPSALKRDDPLQMLYVMRAVVADSSQAPQPGQSIGLHWVFNNTQSRHAKNTMLYLQVRWYFARRNASRSNDLIPFKSWRYIDFATVCR